MVNMLFSYWPVAFLFCEIALQVPCFVSIELFIFVFPVYEKLFVP